MNQISNTRIVKDKISETLFNDNYFRNNCDQSSTIVDVEANQSKGRDYAAFFKKMERVFEHFSQILESKKKQNGVQLRASEISQILLEESHWNLEDRKSNFLSKSIKALSFKLGIPKSERTLCAELIKTRLFWLEMYKNLILFESDYLKDREGKKKPSEIWILFNEGCFKPSYDLEPQAIKECQNFLQTLNIDCRTSIENIEKIELEWKGFNLGDFAPKIGHLKFRQEKELPL